MRALAALVLLSAFAPSQDKVSIPASSLVFLELDGPGKVHSAFEDTRFANLLASPRMGGLLASLTMGVQMGIQALEQETGEDIQQLYDGLMEYSGRVRVGFTFLRADPDALTEDMPPFGMLVALGSDGQTDLGSIAESISKLIEDDPSAELEDLRVDGRTYRVFLDEDEVGVTLPTIVGDDVVVFVGAPLEEAVSRFLSGQERDSFEASNQFTASPLALRINLGSLISLGLEAAMADAPNPMEAEMVMDLLETLGVSSFGAADIMVGAEGEHVTVDFGMELKAGNRGILDLYVPERTGPPAALNLIPRQAVNWSVQPVGFDKVYGLLSEVLAAVGETSGVSLEQVEAQIEMTTGLRLEQDILAHLGDAVISVGDESAFTASATGDVAGVAYGATVKDPAAMIRTMDTLLTSMNLREMLETDEYRGFDVHSLEMPPLFSIQYTITDKLILFGMGEGSSRVLRSVLDQEARVRDGESPGDFPDGVTERLELAPRGWSMVSYIRASDIVNGIISIAGEAAADMPPQVEQVSRLVLGLLKDFGLEDVVAAGSLRDGRLVYRLIW